MTLLPAGEFAPPARPAKVDERLTAAADACRLLGVLFVLLGGFPLFALIASGGPLGSGGSMFTAAGRLLGIATTLMLVGPGVWYFVAAKLIRRAEVKAVRVSLYIVCVQAALIVIGMLSKMLLDDGIFGIPSLLGLFFLPALTAAAVQLVRARRVAASTARGAAFDLLPPRPVVALTAEEQIEKPADAYPSDEEIEAVQSSSFREK